MNYSNLLRIGFLVLSYIYLTHRYFSFLILGRFFQLLYNPTVLHVKNRWKPEEFMNSSSKVFSNRCFYHRNLGIVSIDRNLFSFVFILYNFTNILGIFAFINCRKEWDWLWFFIHGYKVLNHIYLLSYIVSFLSLFFYAAIFCSCFSFLPLTFLPYPPLLPPPPLLFFLKSILYVWGKMWWFSKTGLFHSKQ